MMPRGMTPTRVRRRQSDAKWRASVAMCYNIMKNVIPNQKKLSRRKVSKALTLKETERHIVNLERKLKEVIEDRVPVSGKIVMVQREDNSMYPATFEDIKRDFAHKQHSYFASSNGSGKKRYNVPADIEASLENISQQSCRLVIINRSQVRSAPALLPKHFKPASRKMHGAYQHDSHSHLENLLNSSSQRDDQDFLQNFGQCPKTPTKVTPTPASSASLAHQVLTPVQPTVIRQVTPGTPSERGGDSYLTPTRQNNQFPVCPSSNGFTPVKLPEEPERRDLLLSLQNTPAKSTFGSPFSNSSLPKTSSIGFDDASFFDIEDEVTDSNLLCTESIDLDDLSSDCTLDTQFGQPVSSLRNNELRSEVLPVTPSRKESRCRRKLDQSYQEDVKDVLVPTGEDICTDIDGYLLFYDDNSVSLYSQEDDDKGVDDGLSCMWPSLTPYDKKPVNPGLASSQYGLDDSSSLSADLLDWDLKPMSCHTFKDFSGSSEACQEVPGYDMAGSLMDNGGYSSDLVLDLEHVRFNEHNNGLQHVVDQDTDQVVPDVATA